MKTLAEVTYEKGTQGSAGYAHIDLDKYGVTMDELQAFLNGIMSNKSNRRVVSQVEQSPYNPEFVAKIRRTEQQESKKIDLQKYGISI
ncbi:hypothetical protein AGMMS49965_25640 [Bacteroidia bacterium]|nr:hypothetical protein AGMMS49965_25640 [Bacteroidia bacterium]